VVVLLGGAGLAGYYYGLKQAARTTDETVAGSTGGLVEDEAKKPEGDEITFYSALKEPRKDVSPVSPPRAAEKKTSALAEKKPPLPAVSEARDLIPGNKSIILQVASYRDQANAQKLLQELSSDGYAGTVVRADLGERGIWFRVRIGPYGGGGETESVLKKLRDERKLKGFVVK